MKKVKKFLEETLKNKQYTKDEKINAFKKKLLKKIKNKYKTKK
jgi:hypothetical protein